MNRRNIAIEKKSGIFERLFLILIFYILLLYFSRWKLMIWKWKPEPEKMEKRLVAFDFLFYIFV